VWMLAERGGASRGGAGSSLARGGVRGTLA
jgi:hypothetical protein